MQSASFIRITVNRNGLSLQHEVLGFESPSPTRRPTNKRDLRLCGGHHSSCCNAACCGQLSDSVRTAAKQRHMALPRGKRTAHGEVQRAWACKQQHSVAGRAKWPVQSTPIRAALGLRWIPVHCVQLPAEVFRCHGFELFWEM